MEVKWVYIQVMEINLENSTYFGEPTCPFCGQKGLHQCPPIMNQSGGNSGTRPDGTETAKCTCTSSPFGYCDVHGWIGHSFFRLGTGLTEMESRKLEREFWERCVLSFPDFNSAAAVKEADALTIAWKERFAEPKA